MWLDNLIVRLQESGFLTFGQACEVADTIAPLIAAEVEAEREACAALAEVTICDVHLQTGVRIYGRNAANAIRARGLPMAKHGGLEGE